MTTISREIENIPTSLKLLEEFHWNEAGIVPLVATFFYQIVVTRAVKISHRPVMV